MGRQGGQRRGLLGWLLMLVTLAHGMFASGLIPLLHLHVASHATLAFGLYFGGVLVGQFAIYRVGLLSRSPRLAYPVYELLFAGSLLYMALMPFGPGLVTGRLLEGLAAGLALAILFYSVLQAPGWGTAERRIALFNSVFAVGFVAGPLAVSSVLDWLTTRPLLALYAGVFVVFALVLAPLLPARDVPDAAQQQQAGRVLRGVSWFDTFYTLFYAKIFYGFMLAFATANLQRYFTALTMTHLLLIMSGIFIAGQLLGTQLSRRAPRPLLVLLLPLALSATLFGFYFSGRFEVIFASGLVHSVLALVGYLNVSHRPRGARDFALFNSFSDPGMALGSFVATLAQPGALLVAGLGLVPLLARLRRRPG